MNIILGSIANIIIYDIIIGYIIYKYKTFIADKNS